MDQFNHFDDLRPIRVRINEGGVNRAFRRLLPSSNLIQLGPIIMDVRLDLLQVLIVIELNLALYVY